MTKSSKRKILIIDNDYAIDLANELIKEFYVKIDKIDKIKQYKPSVVIFNNNVKTILSNLYPNTYAIYLSTKFVFSGKAMIYDFDYEPDPLTDEMKKIVDNEKFVMTKKNHLIIRSDFILMDAYIKKLARNIRHKKYYDDTTQLYPIYIKDFAKVLRDLISINANGIIHIRGLEQTTLYKIALKIAKLKDIKTKNIKRESSKPISFIKLWGIVLPYDINNILRRVFYE